MALEQEYLPPYAFNISRCASTRGGDPITSEPHQERLSAPFQRHLHPFAPTRLICLLPDKGDPMGSEAALLD